jgi:hypothetical protein
MNLTAKQLKKVALKLGYGVKEGKKYLLIFTESGLGILRDTRQTNRLVSLKSRLFITATSCLDL